MELGQYHSHFTVHDGLGCPTGPWVAWLQGIFGVHSSTTRACRHGSLHCSV